MGRIMAIDYGKKRVGIAVTDPQKIIANGLTTVYTKDIFIFLENYLNKEKVERVIVGYPKTLANEPAEAVEFLEPFIVKFKQKYPELPVEFIDERFTSKIAFRTMIDGGVKKMDRQNKGMIDEISATIILQDWMESKKNELMR